jgi:hypothetical protein
MCELRRDVAHAAARTDDKEVLARLQRVLLEDLGWRKCWSSLGFIQFLSGGARSASLG